MSKATMSLDKTQNKLMTIDILDVSFKNEGLIVSFDSSVLNKGEKWKYIVLIFLLVSFSTVLLSQGRVDIAIFPGILSLIFIALFFHTFALSNKKESLEIANGSLLFSNQLNSYKEQKIALQNITSIEYFKQSKNLSLFSNKTYFEVVIEAIDKENQKYAILNISSKYSDIDRKARKICDLLMNYIIGSRKKRIP